MATDPHPQPPSGDRAEPGDQFPGTIGLAERPAEVLGRELLASLDEVIALAAGLDLTAPTRLRGRRRLDLIVPLGSWPDHGMLDEALRSARVGGARDLGDRERLHRHLVDRYAGRGGAAAVDALRGTRDVVAGLLEAGDVARLGRRPATSPVGPLPLATQLVAISYDLALLALDLTVPPDASAATKVSTGPGGAAPGPGPSPELLDRGLAGLVDATAGLVARAGVTASVTLAATSGGWRFDSTAEGWTTRRVDAAGRPVTAEASGVAPATDSGSGDAAAEGSTGTTHPGDDATASAPEAPPHGRRAHRPTPVIHGSVEDLLSVSAARVSPMALLSRRSISVTDASGLLDLLPVAQAVPGLPAAGLISTASKALSGLGGLGRLAGGGLGHLPGLGRFGGRRGHS